MSKHLKNKSGFTLAELLVVITIISILITISIPIFFTQKVKAEEATCEANRRSLKAQLYNELINTDATTLEEVAQTTTGKALIAECHCPNNGAITFKGNTILCSNHTDEDENSPTYTLNQMISLTAGSSGWKDAVKTLSNGDSLYTFPSVSNEVLQAYLNAGGPKEANSLSLTWKPVINKDGKIFLIASINTTDAIAIQNSTSITQSAGFNGIAYIIYDGEDYYSPKHSYTGKPGSSYVDPNKADFNLQVDGTYLYEKSNTTFQKIDAY